jgi:ribosomal protein L34E
MQALNKKTKIPNINFGFSAYLCASCLKNRTLPEEAPKVSPCGERLKGVTKQAF